MLNCSNCHAPLEPEASYCGNCGARVEGRPEINIQKHSSDFTLFLNQAIGILIGMVRAPMTTVSALAQSPVKEGSFVLAGLMVVAQALFGLWAMNSIVSVIYHIVGPFSGLVAIGSKSYVSVFFYALFGSLALLVGLYVGSILAVRYLFKANCQSLQLWNVVTAAKVPSSVALLIAIIFSYVIPSVVPIILLLGGMLAFNVVVTGIREAGIQQKDKSAFAGVMSYAVMYLVAVVLVKILAGNIY